MYVPSSDEVLEFEFTVMNLPSFVLVISTQKLESLSVNTGTSSISGHPNFVQRTLPKKYIKHRWESILTSRKKIFRIVTLPVRSLVIICYCIKQSIAILSPCQANNPINLYIWNNISTSKVLNLKHESFTASNIKRVCKKIVVWWNSTCTHVHITCNVENQYNNVSLTKEKGKEKPNTMYTWIFFFFLGIYLNQYWKNICAIKAELMVPRYDFHDSIPWGILTMSNGCIKI